MLHRWLHQVIFLLESVSCITFSPFFHFNELRAFETQDEIASAHVALWLPGWKMILLFHAAGAFSTEIGLLPQCRSVQE